MITSPQKESDGWPNVPLEQVCAKIQDGTHFSPKVQFSEPAAGRYKYVTAKNIRPWGLDLTDITYIDETAHREIFRRCNPERGDVLLTKDGVNTGMVAINNVGEEFSLLSSVALLKPRKDLLDARFLRYFIESPQGSRGIIGKMSGTAIRRIILKRIKEATIPLASLGEQQGIVAEIEKQFTRLDAGVASLKRVQTALKRYRASVLKAACEGQLVPTEAELARKENRSYETGEQLLQRILKERREKWDGNGKYKEPLTPDTANLAPLPEGWAWGTWNQLSNWVTYGFTRPMPHVDTGIPIITAKGIKNGNIDFAEADLTSRDAYAALSEKDRPKRNDILITKDGTIGRAAVVETDREFCINQSVAVIWLRSCAMNRRFLLAVIDSEITQKPIWAKARGVAIQHLSITDFAKLPVPIPPLAEQARIALEVERRISVVDELESETARNHLRANRLRQSILQQAFSGGLATTDGAGKL